MSRPLTPVWVPDETMDYIHRKHGSHITRQDLLDVMYRDPGNLSIRETADKHRADYLVRGQSYSGKRLLICVILKEEMIKKVADELGLAGNPDDFVSLVYNAWEVSS